MLRFLLKGGVMVMTEAEKSRLNELRLKVNRTDEESREMAKLAKRDTREEVPVGTTTQKAELMAQEEGKELNDQERYAPGQPLEPTSESPSGTASESPSPSEAE